MRLLLCISLLVQILHFLLFSCISLVSFISIIVLIDISSVLISLPILPPSPYNKMKSQQQDNYPYLERGRLGAQTQHNSQNKKQPRKNSNIKPILCWLISSFLSTLQIRPISDVTVCRKALNHILEPSIHYRDYRIQFPPFPSFLNIILQLICKIPDPLKVIFFKTQRIL